MLHETILQLRKGRQKLSVLDSLVYLLVNAVRGGKSKLAWDRGFKNYHVLPS